MHDEVKEVFDNEIRIKSSKQSMYSDYDDSRKSGKKSKI